jgi:hypothetical protein
MRSARLSAVVLLALVPASTARASNTAFALPVTFGGAVQVLSFLSVPYVYAPTTAEALCSDLGGAAKVASVLVWNEASSTFVTHTCGSGSNNFTLEEGAAYGARTVAGQSVDALIVGVHDDAFTFSLAPTSGSNLSWVSIPYHQSIPDLLGTPGVVDAEDLCQSVGSSLWAVLRRDAASSRYVAYVCGSVFDTPFPIGLGEGYGLVNRSGQEITWQPPHY